MKNAKQKSMASNFDAGFCFLTNSFPNKRYIVMVVKVLLAYISNKLALIPVKFRQLFKKEFMQKK